MGGLYFVPWNPRGLAAVRRGGSLLSSHAGLDKRSVYAVGFGHRARQQEEHLGECFRRGLTNIDESLDGAREDRLLGNVFSAKRVDGLDIFTGFAGGVDCRHDKGIRPRGGKHKKPFGTA